MKVGMSYNDYGTPVSVHICGEGVCEAAYTLCPAIISNDIAEWGDGCLAEGCPSYDIRRDVDMFWDSPGVTIVQVPMSEDVS